MRFHTHRPYRWLPVFTTTIHRKRVPNAEFAAWLAKQKHPQFTYSLWGCDELRFYNADYRHGYWRKGIRASYDEVWTGHISVNHYFKECKWRPQKAEPMVAEIHCDGQRFFWQDAII